MPKYLGQVVAITTDAIKKTQRELTDAHRALQKPELLAGQTRDYRPIDDDGEKLPSQNQRVQFTVAEMVAATTSALVGLFDAVAARDFTNAQPGAVADIRIGETVMVIGAPMSYVLWLESQLKDLETFARKLPTHDPSTEWTLVDPRGVYSSTPVETTRSTPVPKATVIVPATEKHPAQVQAYTEQVLQGIWKTTIQTGTIPVVARAELLNRIQTLRNAVHVAREEINRVEAVDPKPGARIMEYLFT